MQNRIYTATLRPLRLQRLLDRGRKRIRCLHFSLLDALAAQ
jgi:hypothetical protein